MEWALGSEERSEAWFGEPIVTGDRAFVEWWAVIEETSGRVETLAGVSVLRLGGDGLVAEQHDYWHGAEGRRERPPGWGD